MNPKLRDTLRRVTTSVTQFLASTASRLADPTPRPVSSAKKLEMDKRFVDIRERRIKSAFVGPARYAIANLLALRQPDK
jgi:hypothetical protein